MTVYFILNKTANAVKIGCSQNVNKRLSALQIGTHDKLVIARVIDGFESEEAWLHDHFAAQRLSGEWFNFTEEMMTIKPPKNVSLPRPTSKQVNVRMPLDLDSWLKERAAIRNPHRPNVAGEIIAISYEAKAADDARTLGDKIKTGTLRKRAAKK